MSEKLKLVMHVDRPPLTSASVVNFTGYISNATEYEFINVQVNEASLGNVFSTSALAASGQLSIEYSADINETTTYNFVLTATDLDGNTYTINAEPITVTVKSVSPTPTNFEEAADITEEPAENTGGSFNASKFFLIRRLLVADTGGRGAADTVEERRQAAAGWPVLRPSPAPEKAFRRPYGRGPRRARRHSRATATGTASDNRQS